MLHRHLRPYLYYHCHKKLKDSVETRAALIEIFMLRWNSPSGPPEMTSKKILLSLKGISCLQVIFVLIWMRRDKRCYGSIYKEMELEMDCLTFKETLAESVLEQMSVLHQSMSIFQSSRLVSQFHMMAGQNVKKKYLMRQIPIKMLKEEATPNSRLHNLKIYL